MDSIVQLLKNVYHQKATKNPNALHPFTITHQFDGVPRLLEGLDGGGVGHVDDGRLVNLEYRIVDLEPAVGGGRPAGYQFRYVYGGVVADVGVVGAPGDAEAEAGAAPLQDDLLVLPLVIAVHLEIEGRGKR